MDAPEIAVHPDLAAIARDAADRIVVAYTEAIAAGRTFSIALSGGSAPKPLYELLAGDTYRNQIDWSRVEIFFGDERCVPPDHAESNFRMAEKLLLSRVPIPAEHIHRMRGDIDPEQAGNEYDQLLRQKFGDAGGVDVALQGLGEDGHTASIFPGTPAVKEMSRLAMAQFVEKSTTGKSWRITFTAPFINRSGQVIFLVAGAAKAKVLQQILEGPRDPDRLPAQLIDPEKTRVAWLLDVAAAAMDAGEGEEIEI
jgi:6-phosphogluconolactonase